MYTNITANKLGALMDGLGDALAETTTESGSSGAALLTLYHWGPIGTTELSRIIGLSQPATTRLVAGLRERRLVSTSSVEGRERPLELTTGGLEHAQYLQSQRLAVLDQALAPLGSEDRENLDRIVSTILGGFVEGKKHARRICRNCDHQICVGGLCPVGKAARSIEWKGQKDDSGS
jgi:DNA-binding MarR family transcriptional regulator